MTKAETAKKQELIFVIAGKDDALVGTECQKLVDKLLEPQHRATSLFNADADVVLPCQIFDELRTLPFLTEKRVVIIKGADKFVSDNRQLLENYFDNPSPTGALVLTVSSWPANTRLAKKLPGVGRMISVTEPKPWQLPRKLTEYAADVHDKKLAKPAAELLIELVGDSISRLYSEVDKLSLLADTEKSINEEHIESLIGHNRLFNAFSVIDQMIAGNTAKATNRLRKMFAEDRDAEYTAVGAFAFHFRRMFNAKVQLENGVNHFEIAKRLRIWSNKEGFFAVVRKMSLKQIGENLQRLAQVDFEIKTGRTKAQVAIEQLVLDLAVG